jgi:5-methylcytosine-specific restriction endonuclease McrA
MCSAPLRVSGGARAKAARQSGAACQACGLEWPWNLYVFLRDESRPAVAGNLEILCGRCSASREGPFAPLLSRPTTRDRLRERNNRRTGAIKLTAARRRRLIAARGSACEICGVPGTERELQVHHRLGVFRGGDDSEANLLVLCFACHHRLQPCATGCGRWAKKPNRLCRFCALRARLEELYPDASWKEIKQRMPGMALTWPPDYEPLPVPNPPFNRRRFV